MSVPDWSAGGPGGARVWIVAEAGVNHDGSLAAALELVDAAAEAGADAVKFQAFRAEEVVTRAAPKAAYQRRATGEGGQLELIRALELPAEAFRELQERCRLRGVAFLATPFDLPSLRLLVEDLAVEALKLPSGELDNLQLVLEAARSGLPVLLSTGMASLGEVERALGALAHGYAEAAGEEVALPSLAAFRAAWEDRERRARALARVCLLHCTSQYPAPPEAVNLRAMGTLARAFGARVGLSDHTRGLSVPLAAVALGAAVLEKHFTLDRRRRGPDHAASLEPRELAELVRGVREVEAALGDGIKACAPEEADTRRVARRSVVAARPIAAGEPFSPENLAVRRPAGGCPPWLYWDLLGRPAPRAYAAEEPLEAPLGEPPFGGPA